MRKRTLFTIALASVSMMLGAFSLIKSNQKEVVKEAEAAIPSTIYLKITGTHWETWGNYKAYMWNGGGNNGWGTGATGTEVSVGTETYISFSVGSYDHVIFIASNDWNDSHPQNRTENLEIPSNGNDLFIISTTNASAKQNGSWSKMYAPSGTKLYFVDGYSWHGSAKAYIWGSTNNGWPGSVCSDTGLRLKAYVGETEFSGLYIHEYITTISARYVIFNNGSGQQTGDLLIEPNGVYYYEVSAEKYSDVVNLLITTNSQMGAASFNGNSFSKSICALSQTQAKSFVNTFDTLDNSADADVKSSVEGSAIVTYNNPKVNNTSTGDVTLADIRAALINKYPSIVSTNSLLPITTSGNAATIIVITSVLAITSLGLFFFIKKRKESK